MTERNVLGGPLQEYGTDPMTGYHRDGRCVPSEEDLGGHSICTVLTQEFLATSSGSATTSSPRARSGRSQVWSPE